jgi:hypothetical protein
MLTVSDLVGTWSGPGTMTFFPDHKFQGHDIDLSTAYGTGCPILSGTGTWQFLNEQGSTGERLNAYRQGNEIAIDLPGSPNSCGFELTSWKTSALVTLCFYADPDSGCVSPVFKRE